MADSWLLEGLPQLASWGFQPLTEPGGVRGSGHFLSTVGFLMGSLFLELPLGLASWPDGPPYPILLSLCPLSHMLLFINLLPS